MWFVVRNVTTRPLHCAGMVSSNILVGMHLKIFNIPAIYMNEHHYVDISRLVAD